MVLFDMVGSSCSVCLAFLSALLLDPIDFFKRPAIFCPMMRRITKWHVFIPNEAFLVAKSALGPHGAKPPHIHMTQEKSANFSK